MGEDKGWRGSKGIGGKGVETDRMKTLVKTILERLKGSFLSHQILIIARMIFNIGWSNDSKIMYSSVLFETERTSRK